MLDARITADLTVPEVTRLFRVIRIVEGLSMQQVGDMAGLSKDAVRGRENRGIKYIDDINEYLLAQGYKATVVVQKIRSNH